MPNIYLWVVYNIHIILLCVAHLIEQIGQWNYYVLSSSFDYTQLYVYECVIFVGIEHNIIGVDIQDITTAVSIVEMID